MSPAGTWTLRFAAAAALGLVLPALPPPVVPFIVTVVAFGAWALAADDIKGDERDEPAPALPELPFVPAGAGRRYRPRRVSAAKS